MHHGEYDYRSSKETQGSCLRKKDALCVISVRGLYLPLL